MNGTIYIEMTKYMGAVSKSINHMKADRKKKWHSGFEDISANKNCRFHKSLWKISHSFHISIFFQQDSWKNLMS